MVFPVGESSELWETDQHLDSSAVNANGSLTFGQSLCSLLFFLHLLHFLNDRTEKQRFGRPFSSYQSF